MTVEYIELRKILMQMLADNGINRETIAGFVKDIVDEKVDIAINRVLHEKNMDDLVSTCCKEQIRKEVSDAVKEEVRSRLRPFGLTITVDMNDK